MSSVLVLSTFRLIDNFGDLEKPRLIKLFVCVLLEKLEDKMGEVVVSASKAQKIKGWDKLVEAYEKNQTIMGKITSKCKGGCIVEHIDTGSLMFLPGSQIDTRPLRDVSHLLDVPQKFKVLKMDSKRNNIVVSRRAVLEETHKELREERFSQLALGDVVEGRVKAITDYGAFVDLGGYDSLLHSSDITYRRIGHPSEVLKIDQIVSFLSFLQKYEMFEEFYEEILIL